ncbi:MAG: nitrogen regulation protein NR(II) [Woeseiaceae bacterium]
MTSHDHKAFDQQVTQQSLRPLCLVMAAFYALMTIAHLIVLPSGTNQIVMTCVAGLSSVVSFLIYQWNARANHRHRLAGPMVISLLIIVVANCILHMWLFSDANQTPLFALAIVSFGFFIVSLPVLITMLAGVTISWFLVFKAIGDFALFEHYGFLMAIAVVAATMINIARMQNLRRLESERLQAMQQLQLVGQSHRAFLERVLQTLEPAICAVDADGGVALVNAAFGALVGKDPASATGLSLTELLTNSPLDALLETPLQKQTEIAFGRGKTWVLSETVLPGEQRKDNGRLIVAVDVSSRKFLETEREHLLNSVHEAQRLESLGVMAGAIAHDFNNLLAIIMGSLEMLGLQRPGNEHIVSASTATRDAAELARKLHSQARSETMVSEQIDVAGLLADTIKLLRSCTPRGIEFSSKCDVGLEIVADKLQLQQVLVNVAMNAAESYADGNGNVTMSASKVVASGDALNGQTFVEVKISDNGVGIGVERLPRLFTPFVTTKGPGRGLGLSASKRLIQDYGGEIDVRSAEAVGTTVTILLPAATTGT